MSVCCTVRRKNYANWNQVSKILFSYPQFLISFVKSCGTSSVPNGILFPTTYENESEGISCEVKLPISRNSVFHESVIFSKQNGTKQNVPNEILIRTTYEK
jgi:hypothetical protein